MIVGGRRTSHGRPFEAAVGGTGRAKAVGSERPENPRKPGALGQQPRAATSEIAGQQGRLRRPVVRTPIALCGSKQPRTARLWRYWALVLAGLRIDQRPLDA